MDYDYIPGLEIERSKTWQEEQKVDLFLFDIPTGSIERNREWTDVYVLVPEVIRYLASQIIATRFILQKVVL